MTFRLKTYPPVAADIPFGDIMAARRSRESIVSCLQRLGDFLQVSHLFPLNSGRAALYVILKSAFPPGTKIILPGYTCYTVPAAVVKARMTPVISDSDPNDLGYNLNAFEATLAGHPDAKAVVACHLFGIALDIDAIRAIAGPEMMIIDDAAQAFGIRNGGRYLGTGGDVGFYSFGRGKNLSLVGGGLIVTDNDTIADNIAGMIDEHIAHNAVSGSGLIQTLFYNFAVRPSVFNLVSHLPGTNLGRSEYKPDFDVAGLAIEKVRLLARIYSRIDGLNSHRAETADRYMELLDAAEGITIPRSRLTGHPGNLRFPVLIHDPARRAEILRKAKRRGWGVTAMYPTALNAIPDLAGYAAGDLKNAEQIAASIITLPTHRHMQTADNEYGLIGEIAGLVR